MNNADRTDVMDETAAPVPSPPPALRPASCRTRPPSRDGISPAVPIVAATNGNLEDAVLACTFREDLCYRLNLVPTLLPLRDDSAPS